MTSVNVKPCCAYFSIQLTPCWPRSRKSGCTQARAEAALWEELLCHTEFDSSLRSKMTDLFLSSLPTSGFATGTRQIFHEKNILSGLRMSW